MRTRQRTTTHLVSSLAPTDKAETFLSALLPHEVRTEDIYAMRIRTVQACG